MGADEVCQSGIITILITLQIVIVVVVVVVMILILILIVVIVAIGSGFDRVERVSAGSPVRPTGGDHPLKPSREPSRTNPADTIPVNHGEANDQTTTRAKHPTTTYAVIS